MAIKKKKKDVENPVFHSDTSPLKSEVPPTVKKPEIPDIPVSTIEIGDVIEFTDRFGKVVHSAVRNINRVRGKGQLVSVLAINSNQGYEFVTPKNYEIINTKQGE